MHLIVTVISFGAIFLLLHILKKMEKRGSEGIVPVICAFLVCIVGIAFVFSVFIVLDDIHYISRGVVIDQQIELYQTENATIEKDIDNTVKNYMEHEDKVFSKTDSPITLIQVYPELKSNELVSKQINVYIENNTKIKQLKNKKINIELRKFLLYFG